MMQAGLLNPLHERHHQTITRPKIAFFISRKMLYGPCGMLHALIFVLWHYYSINTHKQSHLNMPKLNLWIRPNQGQKADNI